MAKKEQIILIGSGITVLGTARCLVRAGYAPLVLSETPDLERYSRFYAPLTGPDSAEPLLLQLISRNAIDSVLSQPAWNGAVIIPCSDHAVKAVAESAAAGAAYRTVLPKPELLAALTDKAAFAQMLAANQIPHPRTIIVSAESSDSELEQIDLNSERNFFLKPRDSQAFFRVFGVKGFRLKPSDNPRRRVDEIRQRGLEVVVQEYIPGGADNHIYVEGYISSKGEQKALFARRRLRMYPPDYGNSTAMISIPVAEVQQAADDLLRLLKAVDYRGIFSAEFKLDSDDGLYKLIEINPRAWWYIHFAERCGVNIAALYAADALGRDPAPVESYRIGLSSVYGYYDIYALAHLLGGFMPALAALPRVWAGSSFLVFSLDDPAPAVVTCWRQAAAAVKTRFSRWIKK